jgi:hypothetical protein
VIGALLLLSVIAVLRYTKPGRLQRHGPGSAGTPGRDALSIMPFLLAIFILTYLAFLVVSISFFDAVTPLDHRILSPVFVSGALLVLCTAHRLLRIGPGTRAVRGIFAAACVLFAAAQSVRGTQMLVGVHGAGKGFTGSRWRQSPMILRVRGLPETTPVYTNAPSALYFMTGRPVRAIPLKADGTSTVLNADYPSQITAMGEDIRAGGAVVVYLGGLAQSWYVPSESELRKELSLRVLVSGEEGIVYGRGPD